MAYVLITEQQGRTMDDFRAVNEVIGDVRPEGQIAVGAGVSENGLCVVAIWESKAHADRFHAERLGPALARVFSDCPGAPKVTRIDLEELEVASVVHRTSGMEMPVGI